MKEGRAIIKAKEQRNKNTCRRDILARSMYVNEH